MFNRDKKSVGIMNVIRCDESDYLIWKWHPSGTYLGESSRENSIRWGSSLRVKDGSVAVFVYKQNNEIYQEFIEGPYDDILRTNNLPIIADIIGLAYGGNSPFQAEVYFINLAKIIQSKFAVPFFDIFDPRYTDYSVPVAVRGSLNYKIANYKDFIKLHRLDNYSIESFDKQVRDAIVRYTKEVVIDIPLKENISVIQLERYISKINNEINVVLKDRFLRGFGVEISDVDISAIEIDKTSEGYRQLKALTQDITSATIKAKTEAELRNISDMQRINIEDYEEKLRIQREENQYAIHLQAQSANLDAVKVEKQAEVGVAGAEALGKMGANGAGSIGIGNNDGGIGFNPAAMMASMAIGGTIGQSIAGTMNNIMSDLPKTGVDAVTPPPLNYNVVLNGKTSGPFDTFKLSEMAQAGIITESTLVWRPGMSSWKTINEIDELKNVLNFIPPSIKED